MIWSYIRDDTMVHQRSVALLGTSSISLLHVIDIISSLLDQNYDFFIVRANIGYQLCKMQ